MRRAGRVMAGLVAGPGGGGGVAGLGGGGGGGAAPLVAQQATGTVRGRVTNAATQQPLAGVSVTVGRRDEVTRMDAGYVVSDVPAGTDTVRPRLIAYAPAVQAVTVPGGDTVTLD